MTHYNDAEDNERWLSDGDCQKCRKVKYCKKSCKANNNRINHQIGQAFAQTNAGKVLGAMKNLGGPYL